jgi:hypothetical protein
MEHESSLPYSQQSTTGPYPESYEYSPQPTLTSILILSSCLL